MRSSLLSGLALAAVLTAPAASLAQELAGAPDGPIGGDAAGLQPPAHHRHGGEGECYAQVRFPARYAPPPSGPEYVWTRAPAPPGAPGPVWCLSVTAFPGRPVPVAPERLGWIRVLCADQTTPERVGRLQRRLRERGLYRGEADGRYDEGLAHAVAAFQQQEGIADRGYLSYRTLAALEAPAPPPPVFYRRAPTTFDRGYLSWPGKSRYW